MGFRDWAEGLAIIGMFFLIIAATCTLIGVFGSKMINDLGNFPTKSAEIQASATWKIFLVEIGAFAALGLFLLIFSD